MTERELERNLRAVEHGFAQQRLEGLTVPEATVEDLRRSPRRDFERRSACQHLRPVFECRDTPTMTRISIRPQAA